MNATTNAVNKPCSIHRATHDPKEALRSANITCGDCPFADYNPKIDKQMHICSLGRRSPRKAIIIGTTLDRRPYACPLKWNQALAQEFFPEVFQTTT